MKSKVNYRICGLFATFQPLDNVKVGDRVWDVDGGDYIWNGDEWVPFHLYDTPMNASREDLTKAILEFSKLNDHFEDEFFSMWVELDESRDIMECQVTGLNEISFNIRTKGPVYCDCCGPEVDHIWVDLIDIETPELRLIVEHFNSKLDERLS
jgi:hypothetical protein